MWVRPFGHPSVPGASDQQSQGVASPHLATLPFPSAAPWMFLASRASNAAAAASLHGKGIPGAHTAWPTVAGASGDAATTEKILELHRKLMTPQHQAYVSSLAPTDLRTNADKYASAFRPASTSETEPGECPTSSSMTGYYPSAFIPPKRPRIDSKGSVSPARSSSDRDSSTPSGDARSKSCSPRGSVGSRSSPGPDNEERRRSVQSPTSIHQPWLTPFMGNHGKSN